ncbi:FAD-dependent oxidoreductase [Candidatus Saccharibacteria bacterium]|nr:FAD-dependent oxidoreductase [Candidatus Saccharibacteria bacterium]
MMKVILDHLDDTAKNIKTFWFKPAAPLRYTAGQFIELTLPHDNPDKRGTKHWFTLSSSPTEELLSITTKHASENGSTFKATLFGLEIGSEVTMSEPMGDFVLPKDTSIPLVFIAGGIGVTPIRSMIKWLHDTQEHRTVHLLYAAATIEDVAFRELFDMYGAPTDIILTEAPAGWTGHTGRLDAAKILEIAPNVDNKLYYLSGPEPMVEAIEKDLKNQGVNKRNIVGDFFLNYSAI